MASEFEAEIGQLMMRFNTPGVAVELFAKAKRHTAHMGRLAAGTTHLMTRRARFSTVCLIKLLMTIDLLSLAEKGEISLDDRISDHLPELGRGPKAKSYLKIRHLLSHTSGVRSCPIQHLLQLARTSWDKCVEFLHDTPQIFEPGTVFEDDHLSHIILGQLLSRLRGRPVVDVVCEDVLAPLAIAYSTRTQDEGEPDIYVGRHEWDKDKKNWRVEPDAYSGPDASFGAISHLSMTSASLLQLGEALLARDPASRSPVISPWVKERLFSETVRVPREVSPLRMTRWHIGAFGMGMATFRGGHRGFMTTGRGQNSCIIFDKDRQSVLVSAVNTTNVLEREVLLNRLLAKFAGDTSIVPEPRTLEEVQTREKDVTFASRSQRHIDAYLQQYHLRRAAHALYKRLPREMLTQEDKQMMAELGADSTIHIVRLAYAGRDWNMASKDVNFARGSVLWRWEQGYQDGLRAIALGKGCAFSETDAGIVVHDLPSGHTQVQPEKTTERSA